MIQTKPKKCKGTGLANGYGCGKITLHRVYGLGKMCGCYSDWLLNSENGKIKLQKSIIKATKPRLDLEKAFAEKKNRKTLSILIKSTVDVFHKYIRLRDKGKPCISCLADYNPNFHATHYHKAELYPSLKFNQFNVNGGCQKCNLFLDGNLEKYSINLPKRIGQEKFEEINRLAANEKKTYFKWDREKLINIRNYYNNKIKELNK